MTTEPTMDEEELNEQPILTPEQTPSAQQEAETKDMIEEATKAAERIEAANRELHDLITRQEKIVVQRTLAGRAEASMAPKELSKEEKETAEAKAWLAGTGYEDDI